MVGTARRTTNKRGGDESPNLGMDGLAISHEIYRQPKKTRGSSQSSKSKGARSVRSTASTPTAAPKSTTGSKSAARSKSKPVRPAPAPAPSPYHNLVTLTAAITTAVSQTLGGSESRNKASAYRQLLEQQRNQVEPLAETLHEFVNTLEVGLARERLCTTESNEGVAKSQAGPKKESDTSTPSNKAGSESKISSNKPSSSPSVKKKGAKSKKTTAKPEDGSKKKSEEEKSRRKSSSTQPQAGKTASTSKSAETPPTAQKKLGARINMGDSSTAVIQSKLSLKQKRLSLEGKTLTSTKKAQLGGAVDENTEPVKNSTPSQGQPKTHKKSKASMLVEKASMQSPNTIIID